MANSVIPSYPIFHDNAGNVLSGGFIYIGEAGQNPETHPVTVYLDRELNTTIDQPIRTVAGRPAQNGRPINVYTRGDYSLTVRDATQAIVYSSLRLTASFGDAFTGNAFVKDLPAFFQSQTTYDAGTVIHVLDGSYVYRAVASGGDVQNAGGQRFEVVELNGVIPALAFRPAANGTTDDSALINLMNQTGRVVDLAGKLYEYSGTFTPAATFFNGRIADDNRTHDYTITTANTDLPLQQGRCRLQYGTVSSIRIFAPPQLRMGGFRMWGNWYKPNGRLVNSGIVGSMLLDSSGPGLAVETAPKPINWYAVFAAINNNQSAPTYTQMPFVRAHSVSGNVVTLGSFQEADGDTTTADTYAWADNSLVGAEVLVITENSIWNGRVTTVTANTAGTITLADIGSVTALDKFLIAPPGFDDYVYLGSHLIDTIGGESRNRADVGSYVGMSGANIIGLPPTGEIINLTRYSLAALIPPLATSMKLTFSFSVTTTGTGEILHEFSHDGSDHFIANILKNKVSSSTQNFSEDIDIQFSINQEIYIRSSTSGGIAGSIANRQTRTRGYQED